MKTVRRYKKKCGGTKKSKTISLKKELDIIKGKKTDQNKLLWMQSFNKILSKIKKSIKKKKFLNEHSFNQFLKVNKEYNTVKNVVKKLKAEGDSTMAVKMYTFERNVIKEKFKEIKKKQKSPRLSPRKSPGKSPRKSPRFSPGVIPHVREEKSPRLSPRKSPRKKTGKLKSSISLPEFIFEKSAENTPETPKTADIAALLNKGRR